MATPRRSEGWRGERRAIHYLGMLRSTASWAKVARHLLIALVEAKYPITASELVEDRFEPDFPLPEDLVKIIRQPTEKDYITLTFSSPSDYPEILKHAPHVGMLVYEATSWPERWVRLALEHLERIIVPSAFCLETLVSCGVPREKVGIVPHGIDPEVYHPHNRKPVGSTPDLTLLFVGTTARRKGIDILLRAVSQTFGNNDRIKLIIKTVDYLNAEARPYLDQEWREIVMTLRERGYRIQILTEVMSEPEMGDLYRSADLLCLPTRGEGFGLPLLEAMACGTPILTTNWSGHLDFVNSEVGFLIRQFTLRPGKSVLFEGGDLGSRSMVAEPSVHAVSQALCDAANDRGRLAFLGEAAARAASGWTWASAASHLVQELEPIGIHSLQ